MEGSSLSRRSALEGMPPGARLAAAGPLTPLGSGAAAAARPGLLPYQALPPGTDTLPQVDHIVMENHSFGN